MKLALLKQMVAIPSTFPNEGRLCEFVYEQLLTSGFTVRKQHVAENRFNVLAEKGSGSQSLMFYGHLDTVPLYGKWDTDPYMLTENGDRLFGLGASDMKGGLFAVLKAAAGIQPPEGRKLKIACCVDEENESLGAYALSEGEFLDDVQLIIAAEIDDVPQSVQERCQFVSLGRRGRVGITVSVPGISANTGTPEHGVNAILEAYKFIQAFENMPMPQNENLGTAYQFIQEISAKSGSLSIPDHCDIYISRLLVPPETPESTLKEIQDYIEKLYADGVVVPHNGEKAEARFAERATPYYSPYITEKDNPRVKMLIKQLERHYDNICTGYGLSVADENIFGGVNNIPTITLGPKGGNEHSANEWVSRQSLEKLISVYRDLMQNFEM